MHRLVRPLHRTLHRYTVICSLANLYKSRTLLTLAIESSCDDTSVAILEKHGSPAAAKIHFHEKVTANTLAYGGVHPIIALESHQQNLAKLVEKAIAQLPNASNGSKAEGSVTQNYEEAKLSAASAEGKDVIWCRQSSRYLQKPDFISVTRGPGMRPNLFTGIDTAKGLAIAWQIPLVGVHHMQAHALTPRLVNALERGKEGEEREGEAQTSGRLPKEESRTAVNSTGDILQPSYPFLSLLVSGGHTLLVHSRSLTSHQIWASTSDIAIGDAIDKIARHILPADLLHASQTTMYGALLERFAFKSDDSDGNDNDNKKNNNNDTDPYNYTPPTTQSDILRRRCSPRFHWGFSPPLSITRGGLRARDIEYSFSGILTSVHRFMTHKIAPGGGVTPEKRDPGTVSLPERREMAREAMRVAFEHLATRVIMGLSKLQNDRDAQEKSTNAKVENIDTLVLSGGVAANRFLRHVCVQFFTNNAVMSLIFLPSSKFSNPIPIFFFFDSCFIYGSSFSVSPQLITLLS